MVKKKYLSAPKKVRKHLNELINQFRVETEPNIQAYRTETFMLKVMLECFEIEKTLEIEERIKNLEERTEGINEKL